jgi:hypothetical protein
MVGLAASLGELSEREYNELHQQFALVKRLRDAQADAVSYVLTPRSGASGWEVVQQLAPTSGRSVIVAVADGSSESIAVPLRGVQASLLYELRSADRGPVGRIRGDALAAGGLTIVRAPESAAQVLVIEPVGSIAARTAARQ